MGWRDINLNRRKPRQSFAVVPMEAGLDARAAVLRKAARSAIAFVNGQIAGRDATRLPPPLLAFAAGYAAGYARHQGLKHGVDAEQDMPELLVMLAAEAPEGLQQALPVLAFSTRFTAPARARLEMAGGIADAGYLAGHLEARCGSRKLIATAVEVWGRPDAMTRYLTACDSAADRQQTHEPTASLRFDAAERAVIAAVFSPSAE